MSPHRRLPISARHAFALAFDLAVRRDPTHSLAVPLLLQLPWILLFPLLPQVEEGTSPRALLILATLCLFPIASTITFLLVTAMLRFRARSVYGRPVTEAPLPVMECYRLGAERMPWLFVTEAIRNVLISPSVLVLILESSILRLPSLFYLPLALFFAFRLALATEVVVLKGGNAVAAISRSFRLIEGRFERWLEMLVLSAALVLAAIVFVAVCYLAVPSPGWAFWTAVGWLLVTLMMPVVQYAWTFYYLRLEEIDALPVVTPVPPLDPGAPPSAESARAAGASHPPRLKLVESPAGDDERE